MPFIINVLKEEEFLEGEAKTDFILKNPELVKVEYGQNRAQKLLQYIGNVLVNGPVTPLATDLIPSKTEPKVPVVGPLLRICSHFFVVGCGDHNPLEAVFGWLFENQDLSSLLETCSTRNRPLPTRAGRWGHFEEQDSSEDEQQFRIATIAVHLAAQTATIVVLRRFCLSCPSKRSQVPLR